jgi:hypothetical protein
VSSRSTFCTVSCCYLQSWMLYHPGLDRTLIVASCISDTVPHSIITRYFSTSCSSSSAFLSSFAIKLPQHCPRHYKGCWSLNSMTQHVEASQVPRQTRQYPYSYIINLNP